MFDKLIESDSVQADFKGRSRYFLESSVVVGMLFLAAVVASLYAADIDIGTGEFDMARLLAPEVVEAPEPEPEAAPERTASASSSSGCWTGAEVALAKCSRHPILALSRRVAPLAANCSSSGAR